MQSVAPMGIRPSARVPHGTAPQIQNMDPNSIKIMYKANFDYFCCSQYVYEGCNFCNTPERKYFHVLENAYEYNTPASAWGLSCTRTDSVTKYFFDRGLYSQVDCAWRMGCLKGDPSVYANYSRCVCCCMDCPDSVNQCLNCYYPTLCGDRIMVLTSETVCCCCPTRSCWFNNYCGLCGVKTGDPLPQFTYPLIISLIPGTGVELAANLDNARNQWKMRLANSGVAMGALTIPPQATAVELVAK
mmetsp:Transcript_389/g.237  ORF Transcript_389/g.237 Transcript_389/m.237 type:complete len:244 (-) Transcript_389:211-942(-)